MYMILDVVLIAIIALMVVVGIKRGLVKTCVGLVSTILVLVVAVVAVTPATDLVIVGTSWDEDLQTALESPLADKLPNAYAKIYYYDLDADGETKELIYEIDGVKAPFEDIFKDSAILDFINVAGLLKTSVEEQLVTNAELNEYEDYQTQENSIDFIDGVTAPIVSIVFTVAMFIILLIVTRILIALLLKLLQKIISRLYVVHFIDKMLGGVFGLAAGALFVLVLLTVVQLLSQLAFMETINEFISQTVVTKFLMENNFLYDFLTSSVNLGELMGSIGK
ncbi:MAG: CvpA family protein [Clostridia bacterium]|nr:CvpA family protein [Clostridia bacterium]